MNPILSLGIMLVSAIVGYLVTRWHLSRGEGTVSKYTLLTTAFDDGYNKGFVAGGGTYEERNEVLYERYLRDRSRWVR